MLSPIGTVGLEGLMSRANIWFTSGYRFKGAVDPVRLEAAFGAILDVLGKLKYRMHFETQAKIGWVPCAAPERRFDVITAADIHAAFLDVCRASLDLAEAGRHCPMALCLISGEGDEFIIAQTCEHTWADARSAEVIFDKMIDYYNGSMRGDDAAMAAALEAVERINTIDSARMVALLAADGVDREGNVASLLTYAQADAGQYGISVREVGAVLECYKQQRHAPLVQFFDLKQLLARVRASHPDVTRNSVVCAALAKGFYHLNRQTRNQPEQHIISFKMLSDLLSPALREQYGGNYIAFVPVTVQGESSVEDMALQIHQRIRQFKATKLDLTIFDLTEEAAQVGVVGSADEPLSFVVTNWTNHRFLQPGEYLHGCRSLRHQSGVNIDPLDALGAALVNRPVAVINLSPGDELCLSFFPSLRSQQETIDIAQRISKVIGGTDDA